MTVVYCVYAGCFWSLSDQKTGTELIFGRISTIKNGGYIYKFAGGAEAIWSFIGELTVCLNCILHFKIYQADAMQMQVQVYLLLMYGEIRY